MAPSSGSHSSLQAVPSAGPPAAALVAVAAERVRDYLRAGGLPQEIVDEVASGLANQGLREAGGGGEEAVMVASLRAARKFLGVEAGKTVRPDEVTRASKPLSIRRNSLRSLIDWRLAASRIRRLLPAKAPRRVRHEVTNGLFRERTPLSARARRRRAGFSALILLTTIWGVGSFVEILGVDGLSYLDITHTAIFTILLLWLAQSFWTLFAGAAVMTGRLFHRPVPTPPAPPGAVVPHVAILLPIYNEDTRRVFAGLRAMWEDLAAQPDGGRFDLFVLSDTTDPDVWLAELDAWQALRRSVEGGGRIYYRRRLRNVKRKTGNIEDFITRWGAAYGYMLTLDADSLMSGRAMAELARRMDGNSAVGLIQAPPKLVRGETVFARMLQFAGDLYGPLSAAGISYWALGEGNYWGHNAIIRTAAFADLCGLPLLKGRAPLGGEILSHDFVEAALLRRGGWQVWIADDLGESYEEPPPTISDFATRDRRWCQGNLQHIKVAVSRRLHWVSRLHLAIGIMSYVTSPLWLVFLLLSAAQAWELAYGAPVYFVEGWPFPTLPVSVAGEATVLLCFTLGLLFMPKLFGIAVAAADRRRRRNLGGVVRIVCSAVVETFISALVAPIMMLFHTNYVATTLLGSAIEWKPQRRQASGGAWAEAIRTFGGVTLIGLAAAIATYLWTPLLFFWLVPVFAGLVLAIPLAVYTGSDSIGQAVRAAGLLSVEEENDPPSVMRRLEALLAEPAARNSDPFTQVVLDPAFNALHIAMLEGTGGLSKLNPAELRPAERKAVYLGPSALSKAERRMLLENPGSMGRLHLASWVHWPGARRLDWEIDDHHAGDHRHAAASASRAAA